METLGQKIYEYLQTVNKLTGNRLKLANPIVRAIYEEKSLQAQHWLTLEEFKELI